MLQYIRVLCLAIVFTLPLSVFSEHYNLRILNYTCVILDKRLKLFACDFRQYSPVHVAFDERLMFVQDMGRKLMVNFKIDLNFSRSRRKTRLVDIKFALCDVLSKRVDKLLLMNLLGELRRTSNLPKACPLKRNVEYFSKNYTFTQDILPFFLPTLNFTLYVDFYHVTLQVGSTVLHGYIETT